MTGQLVLRHRRQLIFGGHPIVGVTTVPNKYTHVEFRFTNGDVLYFNDLRQFGYIKLVSSAEAARVAAAYGMEPLAAGFTSRKFAELVATRPRAKVKAALLDQALIAGVGNIYADEACFRARVRPSRRVHTLLPAERRALWRALRDVLALSLKHRGTSFNTYVDSDGQTGGFWRYRQVYGRGGEPCRRCGGILKKTTVAGRGTVYCQRCQR
jgi:formamidopyrimidine-DNA glycosylase